MKETNISKKIKFWIIFWTISGVLMVTAIPIMVVALVKGPYWAVAIPCMAIIGFGFFGQPIGWPLTGMLIGSKKYIFAIKSQITEIRDLAVNFNKRPREVLEIVRRLIRKGYLPGYTLNPEANRVVPYTAYRYSY